MQSNLQNKIQVFGTFRDELLSNPEDLSIKFTANPFLLKERWQANGLSADFLANYSATVFSENRDESSEDETNIESEVKSAVSYIANELLENAMKYSDEKSLYPIQISLQILKDRVVLLLNNSVTPQGLEKYQVFIQELVEASDRNELYIRKLEENALHEDRGSGIGFLTMMNDYLAEVGWKFESIQRSPEVLTVTTMVQLMLQNT